MIQYTKWIRENVSDPYGNCRAYCDQMREAFPELALRRGHYHCPIWGRREHWWLVTPDNQTVDPTAAQFPSKGLGEYVEWDESAPEPTGICMNCGEHCFNGDPTCSDRCLALINAYYGITSS